MAEMLQKLLHDELWSCAEYHEKQLLNRGDLTAAARNIIQQHRKAVVRTNVFFIAFLFLAFFGYIVFHIVARWTGSSAESSAFNLSLYSLLALMHVPVMVDQRARLTRLETLLTLWLLHGTQDPTEAQSTLQQLHS